MSEDQLFVPERYDQFPGSPDSFGNAQQDTEMAENHKQEEHRLLSLEFARRMEAVLDETSRRNYGSC
jgi:hypothetical protein